MHSWKPAAFCLATLGALALFSAAAQADCSGGTYNSTFDLIQKAIFDNHGCSTDVCHGSSLQGGLDLRSGNSYQALFEQPAQTVADWYRVRPGRSDQSLLFQNLAAATLPNQFTAPLRAMPLGLPALSSDELEAVRKWIVAGAPQTGVIAGTDTLLNACLPPAEPIPIEPLAPPAAGTGLQLQMPPWTLVPHSEREVCFTSYYDVTDQVPPEFRSPDGTKFRYKRNEIRQEPLSHHLIVSLYKGDSAPDDPAWGTYQCNGGPLNGQPCSPTNIGFCGDGNFCSTTPVTSVACIGFGPQDVEKGLANSGFTGTQQTASEFDYPEGVYNELPLKGLIVWNSHAFDLTDDPGTLHAWLNFTFAEPDEQKIPTQGIFDAHDIFNENVPAFKTQEICALSVLPPNTHLYDLNSHGHRHMKRWRTYDGAFTCQGGSADGTACSPLGYDFVSPDVCKGSPCKGYARHHVCDCNVDNSVTIDELIASVNIALGTESVEACSDADSNGDQEVTIDELLTGVNAALNGVPPPSERDPMGSLMYVSYIYNDPVDLRFSPPMLMMSPADSERTLTYCGLYDNGYTDPTEVKRQSTSPNPPLSIPGIGGPCKTPTGCVTGKVGQPCSGSNATKRNQSCDSTEGAGDGFCDACTLTGGVTTEDEMFILLGGFYVQ